MLTNNDKLLTSARAMHVNFRRPPIDRMFVGLTMWILGSSLLLIPSGISFSGAPLKSFAYRAATVFADIWADEPTGYWRLTEASGSAAATEAAAVLHPRI
jgi:hypothetical protein